VDWFDVLIEIERRSCLFLVLFYFQPDLLTYACQQVVNSQKKTSGWFIM